MRTVFAMIPLLAALVATTSVAGQGLAVKPGALRAAAGSPVPSLRERQATIPSLLTFRRAKAPFMTVSADVLKSAEDKGMDGWKPLTNGATKGGPAAFRVGNTTSIVVRASDDYLYIADIDVTKLDGPIDAGVWRYMNVRSGSEPYCTATVYTTEAGCTWLDPDSKQLKWGIISEDSISVLEESSPATSSPATFWGPYESIKPGNKGCVLPVVSDSARFYLLNGTTLWSAQRDRKTVKKDGNCGPPDGLQFGVNMQPGSTWGQVGTGFQSNATCGDRFCSAIRNNRVVHWFRPSESDGAGSSSEIYDIKPGVPGGASSTTPIDLTFPSYMSMVIVRNKAGRLYWYRTNPFSEQWADEGGVAAKEAAIACVAQNEQPVCFIQGPDGRIYYKKFPTKAGL